MKEKVLLEDVNLMELRQGVSCTSLSLCLGSMQDGSEVAQIDCNQIMFWSCSLDPDDDLPTYIGEVSLRIYSELNEAMHALSQIGFGFRDVAGFWSDKNAIQLYHLKLEGAAVIEIVCKNYRIKSQTESN